MTAAAVGAIGVIIGAFVTVGGSVVTDSVTAARKRKQKREDHLCKNREDAYRAVAKTLAHSAMQAEWLLQYAQGEAKSPEPELHDLSPGDVGTLLLFLPADTGEELGRLGRLGQAMDAQRIKAERSVGPDKWLMTIAYASQVAVGSRALIVDMQKDLGVPQKNAPK